LEHDIVFLFKDLVKPRNKLVIFNWFKRELVKEYHLPQNFTKLHTQFINGILKRIVIVNLDKSEAIVIPLNSNCHLQIKFGKPMMKVLPIWPNNLLWCIDENGFPSGYDLSDGSLCFYKKSPIEIGVEKCPVQNAFYIESISRMVKS
jgi:hypothetical protein